ncbi:23341_t:CDS:2, partial [Dentiscutata erythropus]
QSSTFRVIYDNSYDKHWLIIWSGTFQMVWSVRSGTFQMICDNTYDKHWSGNFQMVQS